MCETGLTATFGQVDHLETWRLYRVNIQKTTRLTLNSRSAVFQKATRISICSVLTAGDGGVCGRAQSGVHLCRGGLQSGARVHRRLHLPVHACQGPERVSRRGDVLQADQRLGLSTATLHSATFTHFLPLSLFNHSIVDVS